MPLPKVADGVYYNWVNNTYYSDMYGINPISYQPHTVTTVPATTTTTTVQPTTPTTPSYDTQHTTYVPPPSTVGTTSTTVDITTPPNLPSVMSGSISVTRTSTTPPNVPSTQESLEQIKREEELKAPYRSEIATRETQIKEQESLVNQQTKDLMSRVESLNKTRERIREDSAYSKYYITIDGKQRIVDKRELEAILNKEAQDIESNRAIIRSNKQTIEENKKGVEQIKQIITNPPSTSYTSIRAQRKEDITAPKQPEPKKTWSFTDIVYGAVGGQDVATANKMQNIIYKTPRTEIASALAGVVAIGEVPATAVGYTLSYFLPKGEEIRETWKPMESGAFKQDFGGVTFVLGSVTAISNIGAEYVATKRILATPEVYSAVNVGGFKQTGGKTVSEGVIVTEIRTGEYVTTPYQAVGKTVKIPAQEIDVFEVTGRGYRYTIDMSKMGLEAYYSTGVSRTIDSFSGAEGISVLKPTGAGAKIGFGEARSYVINAEKITPVAIRTNYDLITSKNILAFSEVATPEIRVDVTTILGKMKQPQELSIFKGGKTSPTGRDILSIFKVAEETKTGAQAGAQAGAGAKAEIPAMPMEALSSHAQKVGQAVAKGEEITILPQATPVSFLARYDRSNIPSANMINMMGVGKMGALASISGSEVGSIIGITQPQKQPQDIVNKFDLGQLNKMMELERVEPISSTEQLSDVGSALKEMEITDMGSMQMITPAVPMPPSNPPHTPILPFFPAVYSGRGVKGKLNKLEVVDITKALREGLK